LELTEPLAVQLLLDLTLSETLQLLLENPHVKVVMELFVS